MGIFSFFGKSSAKRRQPLDEDEMFARIRATAAREGMLKATRLSGEEEILAERIRKLLLSASWHNGRDARAYENICKEMKQLGEKARAEHDRACWSRINSRVEVLCGKDYMGLSRYMYLLGDALQDARR
jgi:hypothetical protein